MPPSAFLYSIAGLSISLSGFAGLVVSFRRGGQWTAFDTYQARQMPEIGLATALVAIMTLPLVDLLGSASALRVLAWVAVAVTLLHNLTLFLRRRQGHIKRGVPVVFMDSFVAIAALTAGVFTIVLGTVVAFEWLLAFMFARSAVAFGAVVREVGMPEGDAAK